MARKIVCLTDPEYYCLTRKAPELKPRDRLLVLLFLEAGLRVSEVKNLTLGDIYIQGHPVREIIARASHGTIGEPRGIAVSPRLLDALIAYRAWIEKENRNTETASPVFMGTKKGEPLTVRAMEWNVSKITKATIGRAVWPHALRHTFATWLMRVASIRVVQELLGHKKLSSTQIYTHPNQNDCNSAVEKAFT